MFYYEKRDEINRQWFAIEEEVNFSYPMHLHRWYEVVLIVDGELDISVDGKLYHLVQYDTLFIFPNQMHEYISTKPSHHKLCLFRPETIAYFNNKMKNSIPDNPCKNVRDEPWLQLFLDMKRDDPLETIKGILYYYCGMFSGDKFKNIAECDMPDNQDLMHRIFKFAEEHFQDKCTLSDLSSHIGYDYSYLSKLFSDKIGMSFTEYVNMLRIDKACYLLKNTDLPILNISEQCGYGSIRSFNRNFIRRMNVTPREYRKSPQEGGQRVTL